MLRVSAIAFGAFFLFAEYAAAFEGRYVAGDKAYRQELTIAKRADGRFDVTAVVGTEGCSGLVEARGEESGDTLKAIALEDKTCALSIRRTGTGIAVEPENCESFHGAACDFSGDYRKRR